MGLKWEQFNTHTHYLFLVFERAHEQPHSNTEKTDRVIIWGEVWTECIQNKEIERYVYKKGPCSAQKRPSFLDRKHRCPVVTGCNVHTHAISPKEWQISTSV